MCIDYMYVVEGMEGMEALRTGPILWGSTIVVRTRIRQGRLRLSPRGLTSVRQ